MTYVCVFMQLPMIVVYNNKYAITTLGFHSIVPQAANRGGAHPLRLPGLYSL